MNSKYLFPGQFFVATEPSLITTILGSCVAVALYDPNKRIAGLNHFLLPYPAQGSKEQSLRYGSVSLPLMLEELIKYGAVLERLQAKIYGGARVIENVSLAEGIGKLNIDFAREWLREKRIPIHGNDLAGTVGRKIILNSSDFSVKHQFMNGATQVDTSGSKVSLLSRIVRAVVVDDSAAVRSIFSRVLGQSGRVDVVGVARDAFEAREVIVEKKPDVVLLDIEMPGMSGIKFLESLMKHYPLPTIMVSSLNASDDAAVRALELGALEYVQKPHQFEPNSLRFFAESLVQKVVAAASSAAQLKTLPTRTVITEPKSSQPKGQFSNSIQMVLVGGNGGAHRDLEVFLQSLPSDTPPILVSVSSVSSLLPIYLERWKNLTETQLKIAEDGEVPAAGTVYFPPPQHHLRLENLAGRAVMRVQAGVPVNLQIPSADQLFQSAVEAQGSSKAGVIVGILMGGVGTDGAQGLLRLREWGGLTLVSHPDSCLFSFVPQSAIGLGAADHVLQPDEFAQELMRYRSKVAV